LQCCRGHAKYINIISLLNQPQKLFGINDFQAVINPPQAAILAIGGIRECPIVKEGQIVVGKQMTLSLSCDHRVIDGSDSAKFLKTIQKHLENPAILLI